MDGETTGTERDTATPRAAESFAVLDFLPEPVFVVAVEQLGARFRVQWTFANRAWGLPCYYAGQLLIAWSLRG